VEWRTQSNNYCIPSSSLTCLPKHAMTASVYTNITVLLFLTVFKNKMFFYERLNIFCGTFFIFHFLDFLKIYSDLNVRCPHLQFGQDIYFISAVRLNSIKLHSIPFICTCKHSVRTQNNDDIFTDMRTSNLTNPFHSKQHYYMHDSVNVITNALLCYLLMS
jgi:hypothetical protein